MDNKKRIDEFLKYFAKIGIQNPNYSFSSNNTCNHIYSELITRNVSKKDKSFLLAESFGSPFKDDYSYTDESLKQYKNSIFYRWIEHYKNHDKIDVFRTQSWPYFCQFISKDKTARASNEHIKIYVPLDSEHIEKGAKLIFDFLNKNDISHVSKIGKEIRFDDIVVRLIKEEDAKKLLNFVKNNSYIQEGLLKPNPFAFQEGNIALACDGDKSYNYTVTQVIAMYLDKRKKDNSLDKVSYQDFYHFLADFYKQEFINNNHSLNNRLDIKDKKSKENYKHIIALMLKSQSDDFTLEDYFNHYRHSVNSKKEKEEININSKELLLETIKIMTEKYGKEIAYRNIEFYLTTNNSDYITRTNNLREKVINSSLRNEIRYYLEKEQISFRDYVNKFSTNNNIDQLLIEAIEESGKRFNNNGKSQVRAYIISGRTELITRNNNLRERVIKTSLREKILEKIKEDNISLDDYINNLIPNKSTQK